MKVIVDLDNPEEIAELMIMVAERYPEMMVDDEEEPNLNTVIEEVDVPTAEEFAHHQSMAQDVAQSTTTETAPKVDKSGRPWDGRIDSQPPALTAKNEWRARRKPKSMSDEEWSAFRDNVVNEITRAVAVPPTVIDSLFPAEEVEEQPLTVTYDTLKSKIVAAMMDDSNPYFTEKTLQQAYASCGISNIIDTKDDNVLVSKLNKILFG